MPDLDAIDDLARLPAAGPAGSATTLARRATGARATSRAPRETASRGGGAPRAKALAGALARHLDVVAVVVAAPLALALGARALGYTLAAGAWLAQRGLAHLDRRWIGSAREPGRQMGLNLFEAFGRIWLLAGAIVAAGLIGTRADGLTAALVVFVAYSIAFAMRLIDGRPQGGAARGGAEL
jgi:hypothetical protein